MEKYMVNDNNIEMKINSEKYGKGTVVPIFSYLTIRPIPSVNCASGTDSSPFIHIS